MSGSGPGIGMVLIQVMLQTLPDQALAPPVSHAAAAGPTEPGACVLRIVAVASATASST